MNVYCEAYFLHLKQTNFHKFYIDILKMLKYTYNKKQMREIVCEITKEYCPYLS